MYKKLFYVGIVPYLVLLVLSCLFYKERIIFADAANYMVYVTKTGSFSIEHYRYGVALLQILPLLGIKASASLDHVILLFSTSYALYYLGCYLLCGFAFKNYKMALVLLLFNTLFCTYTFYYMISELPIAIAMFLVVLSYINTKMKLLWWQALIAFTMLITVVFLHPVAQLAIVFCLLFFLLSKEKESINKKYIVMIGIALIIIIIIKRLFFTGYYEARSSEILSIFPVFFPKYFSLYSHQAFLQNCITNYYWIPVISALIIIGYILTKKWLKLALFLLFTIGYLVLVNTCFPTNYTRDFYMENLYLPIGLFIALPFVFDILPILLQAKKNTAIAMIALICATCCIRIYVNHKPYTNRLAWERKFLDKHPDEKLIVPETPAMVDTLFMTWATPYEFWMLSTIERGKTASIIINDQPVNFLGLQKENKEFGGAWAHFSYSALPKKYFIFPDSTNTYRLMND